jgi:uncharacterized protein (DUF362 family)
MNHMQEIPPTNEEEAVLSRPRVILRHCETYDPIRIAEILGEGMDELGVIPQGRTMIKPNVVISHKEFFPHAYTRAEFLDGLIAAVKKRNDEISELSIGERCGITIPTRYAFATAGYPKVLRKHGVRSEYFDEGSQVRVDLKHPDAMRDFILVPEGIANCEFLINAPKFKAHPWTKVTFSLKNYIGIQDDAQRLIDHDHKLHTKIADLQEVISPGFIAVDGIIAGEHTMLTPTPFPLQLIVMGINPVAVDSVCTHIVGLNPKEVDHIRISAERGYGPLDLEDIEITGDVSLDQAHECAKGLRLTTKRIEEIFNNRSNITTYVGPPPEMYDYCWGGCPGSLFEAMQIIEIFQPNVYHEIKRMHIVLGSYEGEIRAQSDEPVLFVGDCAVWEGTIKGQPVKIPFLYKQRNQHNPYTAKSGDVVMKMIGVIRNLIRYREQAFIRVKGCPVSVAENVHYLSWTGKVTNPYFHPKILYKFIYYWSVSKIVRLWRRMTTPKSGMLKS